jgi:glucoamylase
MRIRPPECGDPYAHEECGKEMVHLNNIPPGEKADFEAREVIDAGFLELVRYGVRTADDPLIVDSLKVVDHVLKVDTPKGPCWLRYNHDGYGQREDGGPFLGWGKGHAWPLLTGERAHYELAAGRDVCPLIKTIEQFASGGGMLPEQIWDQPDLDGLVLGGPAGSAMPLIWAHSEYLKLLRSSHDGEVFDRIPVVQERYARGNAPGSQIEVFKVLRRQIRQMPAGKALRITSASRFRVTWTPDNWQTTNVLESTQLGYAGSYADLSTSPEQRGSLSFTLFWPDDNGSAPESNSDSPGRWEGRNFEVLLESSS